MLLCFFSTARRRLLWPHHPVVSGLCPSRITASCFESIFVLAIRSGFAAPVIYPNKCPPCPTWSPSTLLHRRDPPCHFQIARAASSTRLSICSIDPQVTGPASACHWARLWVQRARHHAYPWCPEDDLACLIGPSWHLSKVCLFYQNRQSSPSIHPRLIFES